MQETIGRFEIRGTKWFLHRLVLPRRLLLGVPVGLFHLFPGCCYPSCLPAPRPAPLPSPIPITPTI